MRSKAEIKKRMDSYATIEEIFSNSDADTPLGIETVDKIGSLFSDKPVISITEVAVRFFEDILKINDYDEYQLFCLVVLILVCQKLFVEVVPIVISDDNFKAG